MTIDYAVPLKWFTGKSKENAKIALDLLKQSEAEGCWISGASRKVRSALNKANVVKSKLKAIGNSSLERFGKDTLTQRNGFSLYMSVYFGPDYLLRVDIDNLKVNISNDHERAGVELGVEYYNDFIEIARLMRQLDDTRPKPVFTSIGLSPTVTETLRDTKLDLDITTVRSCPWKAIKVQRTLTNGNVIWDWDLQLDWPKNTWFGMSRHAGASARGNRKCEACGHTILNPFNWVPILVDDNEKVPYAFIVGRDCARSVFGIKVTGDLNLKGRLE